MRCLTIPSVTICLPRVALRVLSRIPPLHLFERIPWTDGRDRKILDSEIGMEGLENIIDICVKQVHRNEGMA